MSTPRLGAVIFDFDGVLAESNRAKDDAFEALFARYPEHTLAMRAFHEANRQTPRSTKFRHFLETLFDRAGDETLLAELDRTFTGFAVERVLASADVPGARALLQQLHGRVPLYVSSVTPHEELQHIVVARGLQPCFAGVFGNPPHPKREVVRRVMERHQLAPEQVVFVGDSLADYEVARDTGVAFLGRKSEHAFVVEGVELYADLYALAPLILARLAS